jgi:hypothetical protein
MEQKIKPLLRMQKGFCDAISLVAAQRNEATLISFWATQEDADAYNHVAYLDVLRLLSNLVQSVPIVETFDDIDSTLPFAPGI